MSIISQSRTAPAESVVIKKRGTVVVSLSMRKRPSKKLKLNTEAVMSVKGARDTRGAATVKVPETDIVVS